MALPAIGEEVTGGYKLLGSVMSAGGEQLVIAYNPVKDYEPFVSWRWDEYSETPFSGHYVENVVEAVEDAKHRAGVR